MAKTQLTPDIKNAFRRIMEADPDAHSKILTYCNGLLSEIESVPLGGRVIKPNGGFVIEGELIEKNVTHDETILRIEDSGENAILILPRDLDDFVKVGSILKITIEEC